MEVTKLDLVALDIEQTLIKCEVPIEEKKRICKLVDALISKIGNISKALDNALSNELGAKWSLEIATKQVHQLTEDIKNLTNRIGGRND
jgi:carbamoylphosphate synthase large subunit